MSTDLENSKWVRVHIGLMGTSRHIINVKRELKDYANELNWTVYIDKEGIVDEDGQRLFGISIAPKNWRISPEELRKKIDLIKGFAFAILQDVLYSGRKEELPETFYTTWTIHRNKDKKDILYITFAEILIIECSLKKAIKLECQNQNLSKKVFGMTLNEWYKENLIKKDKIFLKEEERKGCEAIIQILQNNGMPKKSIKKKHFLKRLF